MGDVFLNSWSFSSLPQANLCITRECLALATVLMAEGLLWPGMQPCLGLLLEE